MGYLGDLLEIRHIQLGIADSLGINGPGLGVDGLLELLRLAGVYEYDFSSEFREGVVE